MYFFFSINTKNITISISLHYTRYNNFCIFMRWDVCLKHAINEFNLIDNYLIIISTLWETKGWTVQVTVPNIVLMCPILWITPPKILCIITLDKRMVDKKSTNLEKAGLVFLLSKGMKEVEVVTDARFFCLTKL